MSQLVTVLFIFGVLVSSSSVAVSSLRLDLKELKDERREIAKAESDARRD